MKLGVTGMMPEHLEQVDQNLARKIAELGFSGVGVHLAGDPTMATKALCQRTSTILAEQGIRVIQFWGFYSSIISTDEATRREGIKTAQEIIRVAGDLGAPLVGIRPTSMNPEGPWWPHPDNYAPATRQRLIQSLRDIAQACEEHGVQISLEGHVTTTLNSAESVRQIIEEVGSPWVKFNLDPVNFVADLVTAYHTTGLINHLFDTLAPHIAALHVKDVYVENRHVVHISETIPGDGLFDFDTLFRRFETLLPDGYAFIEHLPEAQVPQAKVFVDRKLRELNITVRS